MFSLFKMTEFTFADGVWFQTACQSTDLQSCNADFGDCASDEVHLEAALHSLAVGGSGVAYGRHHCQPAQQLRVKYALYLMSLHPLPAWCTHQHSAVAGEVCFVPHVNAPCLLDADDNIQQLRVKYALYLMSLPPLPAWCTHQHSAVAGEVCFVPHVNAPCLLDADDNIQQLRVKYASHLMSMPFACLMHTSTFSSCGWSMLLFIMSLLFACLMHTSTNSLQVDVCVAFACHCFMAEHLLHQERCSM